MKEQDNRAIVVGVDGSPGSKAALAFALEEGLARGVTVEVVTTWLMAPVTAEMAAPTYDSEHQRAQERQDAALAEVLEGFQERPTISQVVLHEHSGQTLVDSARDAALLVLGSGRKNVLARTLLGSVSEYCVRHSVVPVVVVPDPARVAEKTVHDEIVTQESAPASG
jgi:nucleotide-binding universal stress UspA family protein